MQQKQLQGSGLGSKDGAGAGDGAVRSGKQEKELSVKAAAAVANTKPLTSFFAAAAVKK